MPVRLACLQLNPGADLSRNLEVALAQARAACDNGAQLLLLPEFALMLHASGRIMRETAHAEDAHPGLAQFRAFARERGTWVLLGSLTVTTDDGRIANRAYLIDGGGDVFAVYDKIHMFDATLPTGRTVRESSLYRPGEHAVVAKTPFGAIGMSICYDLRFPQLYRALAQAGAQLIVVPSAFARSTGRLHWHTLVKARAIENACFVFAPAMCGEHPGNRTTYGHSLVVDPWGEVLADGGESPGIVYADIDPAQVAKVRGMLPCLEHDRAFSL